MKIYCIFESHGQWDYHHNDLVKAFDTEYKAKLWVDLREKELNDKKSLIPEYPDNNFFSNLPEDFSEEQREEAFNKKMSEISEAKEKYPDWMDWEEFNECFIKEIEVE